MAHNKHTLVKDFGRMKEGSSIIISDNQIDYFIEQGLIEVKGKRKKKKKTETKSKVQDTSEETNNL